MMKSLAIAALVSLIHYPILSSALAAPQSQRICDSETSHFEVRFDTPTGFTLYQKSAEGKKTIGTARMDHTDCRTGALDRVPYEYCAINGSDEKPTGYHVSIQFSRTPDGQRRQTAEISGNGIFEELLCRVDMQW